MFSASPLPNLHHGRTDNLVYRTLTPDCNSHTMKADIRKKLVIPGPTCAAAGPHAEETVGTTSRCLKETQHLHLTACG